MWSELTHICILVLAKAVKVKWFLVYEELCVCHMHTTNTQRLSIKVLHITSTHIHLEINEYNFSRKMVAFVPA